MDFTNTSDLTFEMSEEAFVLVNMPVSLFSILLNISLFCCMIFPQQGGRVKQLLKTLLGSLVGCNFGIHFCIVVMLFFYLFVRAITSYMVKWSISSIVIYTMMISVNSSHWLNVFYCFQIIPVQHSYFIWLKKNIRVFIYSSLFINIAVCLLGMSVNIWYTFLLYSDTNITDSTTTRDFTRFNISYEAAFYIKLSLYILSFCVMLGSSLVTVFFLWRHIKNMEKKSGSSSRHQRNIKWTITSISVQALLHITCSALVIIDELLISSYVYNFDMNRNILCTVISLYSFATTINLGLSQSVFRQRAVHVRQNCFRPFQFFICINNSPTSLS